MACVDGRAWALVGRPYPCHPEDRVQGRWRGLLAKVARGVMSTDARIQPSP